MDIPNLSALSPNKFKVIISLFPEVEFFAQKVELPGSNIEANTMSTNSNLKWKQPGDTLEFDPLKISFLVDEDMLGYRKILEWQKEITTTENKKSRFSDISIMILTNNSNKNLEVKCYNTFPMSIDGPIFGTDMDEDTPIQAVVSFALTDFEIVPGVVLDTQP